MLTGDRGVRPALDLEAVVKGSGMVSRSPG